MPHERRDNFSRMMSGREPRRLPLDIPVTPPVADLIAEHTGQRDPALAFGLDFRGVGADAHGEADQWRAAVQQLGVDVPDNCDVGGLGEAVLRPDAASVGEAYHFVEKFYTLATIESVDQLQALPWPDVNDPRYYAHLDEQVAAAVADDRVVVGHKACTVFESAWYRRGMDNLFMDLVEGNGIGDWLLDWFAEHSIAAVRAYVKAGVDVVHLGDDVGTQRGMMMAPDFWRQHLKGRLARVVAAARDAAAQRDRADRPLWVFYHSDGDIRAILDELAEIGIDIVNPVQPECMPPEQVIPAHQHHLRFWGMIGTQTTMPFGTPDDVRAAVEQCAAFARDGAGIVIAPTHVLEPEVPWANIEALVEAARAVEL